MRGRYYDPQTQQFISRDPLEASAGQPYAYAWGNPVNYTDPTGSAGEQLPAGGLPTRGASQGLGGGLESGLPDTGYIGSAYQLTGGRLISDVPRGIKDVAPQKYPTLISPSEGRKARGDAGQLAVETLAGAGNRQVRFDTPTGIRVVDWVTIEGDTIFAHESSLAERPIYGNQQKLGEVAKDAWLMQNMEGYQPVWHFWQGAPAGRLLSALISNGIPFTVYNR